jgi:flagellar biosynthesis GTPase FlhF
MGITFIEQIGIVAGIVIGISGFIYSVAQSRRQRKHEQEQTAEQRKWEERQAAEQRRWEEKQAAEQREREEKQAAEQRKREEKQAAEQRKREEKQAAEQREREEKQAAEQREQAAKQELKDRLSFLSNLIVDKDIPRRSRQGFFDEYIAKGGNGSFVKFWYNEEKELEARNR